MTTSVPEPTTIPELFAQATRQYGDRPALIFPDRVQSYREIEAASLLMARRLHGLGIGPGDQVGILMANCHEFIELLLAATLLGATAVPLNARYKSRELAYVIDDADLKVLITSDLIADHADFVGLLRGAFTDLDDQDKNLSLNLAKTLQHIVLLGEQRHPAMLTVAEFAEAGTGASEDEIRAASLKLDHGIAAIMMYTSGTTANPKGCPLSHGLLTQNGRNMNRSRYFLSSEDVFWAPLPMFHMSSILPFLACIDAGAAMASMVYVDAGPALAMMERYGVTVAFPSFPTVTNDLINHADFASRDLSKLRRINNVAPIEMLRRFQDAFPQAVQTGAYGLTEAGGVIAFNHPEETLEERLHTCGKPMPGIEVQITDPETLTPLPQGHRGEMWIRGYAVFAGYHKSPEKNAEAFHDGWFRTGDLCSLSEQGAVCYHGRIKDMLKVGGENVAAIEIESHLATHPGVLIAQVVGRKDERLWEVPVAFVERAPGADPSEEELIEHCRALASFKVPREVHFVEEWPMSSTKIQKFKLQELLD